LITADQLGTRSTTGEKTE